MTELASIMKSLSKDLRKGAEGFFDRLVTDVQYEIANKTPVDTGAARSNWIVGDSPQSPIPPHAPGRRLGIGESANLAISIHAAQRAVKARRKAIDPTIGLHNTVYYIGKLNQGHSRQARAGFVQLGILTGVGRSASYRIL